MSNYRHGNGGAARDHIRNTFLDAVEAYRDWEPGMTEPTVAYRARYFDEEQQVSISRACGIVWNCSDILPHGAVYSLEDCGIELGRRTYAAAARVLLPAIKNAA